MAYFLVHCIVLAFCVMRLSGAILPVDEIMAAQQEKDADKLEMADMTEVSIGHVDTLSTSSTTPEGTTTKSHSLVPLLNSFSSTLARADATASSAATENAVIDSVGVKADMTTFNGTKLRDATESTPIVTQLSSTAKTMASSEMTPTLRTYPDAESSAESFDSAESFSSMPFLASVSNLAPIQPSPDDVTKKNLPPPTTLPPFWPWMLFIINGNATVANRRQRDLGTYLRLNLAARLDADYNVSNSIKHFWKLD